MVYTFCSVLKRYPKKVHKRGKKCSPVWVKSAPRFWWQVLLACPTSSVNFFGFFGLTIFSPSSDPHRGSRPDTHWRLPMTSKKPPKIERFSTSRAATGTGISPMKPQDDSESFIRIEIEAPGPRSFSFSSFFHLSDYKKVDCQRTRRERPAGCAGPSSPSALAVDFFVITQMKRRKKEKERGMSLSCGSGSNNEETPQTIGEHFEKQHPGQTAKYPRATSIPA